MSTHAHQCTLSRLPAIQPPRRCCTAQGRGALAGYGISRLTADFTAQLQAQRRLPFWPVWQVPVPCSQTVDTGKRAFKMLPFAPLALPADELTGFEHNGVSPIGVRTRMPIIMSHRCPPASPAAPSPHQDVPRWLPYSLCLCHRNSIRDSCTHNAAGTGRQQRGRLLIICLI